MKILALDTATEACSVALKVDDAIVNEFNICPQQQSQQIIPMIDRVLCQSDVSLSQLDAIAYTRGPGSFTGVRIAASTVQGLAFGADLPVLEISTLATMAQECFDTQACNSACVLIDARMQEVYQGIYTLEEGVATLYGDEKVQSPDVANQDIITFSESKDTKDIAYAGTGFTSYQAQLAHCLQNKQVQVNYPNARYMLSIAEQAFSKGLSVSANEIKPVYVRDTVTWKKLPHKQ